MDIVKLKDLIDLEQFNIFLTDRFNKNHDHTFSVLDVVEFVLDRHNDFKLAYKLAQCVFDCEMSANIDVKNIGFLTSWICISNKYSFKKLNRSAIKTYECLRLIKLLVKNGAFVGKYIFYRICTLPTKISWQMFDLLIYADVEINFLEAYEDEYGVFDDSFFNSCLTGAYISASNVLVCKLLHANVDLKLCGTFGVNSLNELLCGIRYVETIFLIDAIILFS